VVVFVAADTIAKPGVMPPGVTDPIQGMIKLAYEAGVTVLRRNGSEYGLAADGLAHSALQQWPPT